MNNQLADYDGRGLIHQPSHVRYVDFTNTSEWSRSASGETGYFDVYEELGVDWAFIHLETSAKLDVEFLEDTESTLFPFQAGTDEGKVKRIYYNADNTTTEFWLRW
jgi:hypothetical protein